MVGYIFYISLVLVRYGASCIGIRVSPKLINMSPSFIRMVLLSKGLSIWFILVLLCNGLRAWLLAIFGCILVVKMHSFLSLVSRAICLSPAHDIGGLCCAGFVVPCLGV